MASAKLDKKGLYTARGTAWLICPQLLKFDPRHGERHDRWAPCRRGLKCIRPHEHESELIDPEGHLSQTFIYVPGSRPYTKEEWPVCECGLALVWSDGDPI